MRRETRLLLRGSTTGKNVLVIKLETTSERSATHYKTSHFEHFGLERETLRSGCCLNGSWVCKFCFESGLILLKTPRGWYANDACTCRVKGSTRKGNTWNFNAASDRVVCSLPRFIEICLERNNGKRIQRSRERLKEGDTLHFPKWRSEELRNNSLLTIKETIGATYALLPLWKMNNTFRGKTRFEKFVTYVPFLVTYLITKEWQGV